MLLCHPRQPPVAITIWCGGACSARAFQARLQSRRVPAQVTGTPRAPSGYAQPHAPATSGTTREGRSRGKGEHPTGLGLAQKKKSAPAEGRQFSSGEATQLVLRRARSVHVAVALDPVFLRAERGSLGGTHCTGQNRQHDKG